MTGFVRIAPEGYHTEASLKAWPDRALDFVTTLPAKRSAKHLRSEKRKIDVDRDRPGVDAQALAYVKTVKRPRLTLLYAATATRRLVAWAACAVQGRSPG
jgi:hypothetical protein